MRLGSRLGPRAGTPALTPGRPGPVDMTATIEWLERLRTGRYATPGAPTAVDGSVGGPLLWPVDEAWPMCAEHGRVAGVRPERARVYCAVCGAGIRLPLTLDAGPGARGWRPFDEGHDTRDGTRPPSLHGPAGISAARDEYLAFVCPAGPSHPHRTSSR
ncbi:hypothetical protein [Streptomyces lateritius]|uniref:hypothetical protein n=1 Tax=Streptomyces lateritius TaxID=67313 RepID=UPI0016745D0D|nr:hypothetical protein [Streptomyces lateritius]GGT65011.1 hypothetical protein GCM10010272_04240 [Streptomyces lateritius]